MSQGSEKFTPSILSTHYWCTNTVYCQLTNVIKDCPRLTMAFLHDDKLVSERYVGRALYICLLPRCPFILYVVATQNYYSCCYQLLYLNVTKGTLRPCE